MTGHSDASSADTSVDRQPDQEPVVRFTRGRASRGKGLRKTTGCLTCRRRHVRCDEVKPVCSGCIRKRVACVYPGRQKAPSNASSSSNTAADEASVAKNVEIDTTPGPDPEPRTTQTQQEPETGVDTDELALQPENADDIYTADEAGSELHQMNAAELQNQLNGPSTQIWGDESLHSLSVLSPDAPGRYDSIISACGEALVPSSHPPQPMFTGLAPESLSTGNNAVESPTARWLGLLLGDATLDNGNFHDLDFETDGLDIFGNSIVHTPRSESRPTAKTGIEVLPLALPSTSNFSLQERTPHLGREQLSEKQIWHSSDAIELLDNEHAIFQHFVQHISCWLDLFEPKRPFGTLVPHLAVHNVGLMNAILALSLRHLSLNIGQNPVNVNSDALDSNAAVRYYYKTLHYSREAMKYDTYKTSLELLAISIIISTYEMLDGSSTDWERHLQGVFWIQRSQVIHGDSGGLRQAVWWAWLCQDVWAAFCEKRRPLTFWRPMRSHDALDPYELGARSVYIFAQVVGFCSTEEITQGRNDLASRSSKADGLLEVLEDWRRHLTVEFEPLPLHTTTKGPYPPVWVQPPAFGVAMQLYYCSLMLIFLHQPLSSGLETYFEQRRSLKKCIKMICGIAKTLTDSGSSVMSAQCVYIAGLSVDESDGRGAILDLLESARQRSGWPVRSLGSDLKQHWQKMDQLERS